ncbi:hypothetical protein [Micromonospora sp. CB01531]|uniref:hypothetical protein n=1 Tax=Micromonospora sp. CB01531 TaxID=1718947 RepID=UPI00093C7809|nr:hypothetical protein [Micromonospora sp. CB01531]OKI87613.1 hypothetical protein A6A27_14205 [Micromonospora sp. CB01531]
MRNIERYNRWEDPEKVVDHVEGAYRVNTTNYDPEGRVISTWVSNDLGGSLGSVTTVYDTATGNVVQTLFDGVTITREYDLLGRLAAYTDADGGRTVNEFDRYGKPSKVSDPTGYSTFTYDRAAEPRGLLTSVTDSIAGTFSAKYSPDGQLTELKYPGGLTRTDRLNAETATGGADLHPRLRRGDDLLRVGGGEHRRPVGEPLLRRRREELRLRPARPPAEDPA